MGRSFGQITGIAPRFSPDRHQSGGPKHGPSFATRLAQSGALSASPWVAGKDR